MNAKTAKLINRLAVKIGKDAKLLKRHWNRTPRPQRHEARRQMEDAL